MENLLGRLFFIMIMVLTPISKLIIDSPAFAIGSLTVVLYSYYFTIIIGMLFFEYVYTLSIQLTNKVKCD